MSQQANARARGLRLGRAPVLLAPALLLAPLAVWPGACGAAQAAAQTSAVAGHTGTVTAAEVSEIIAVLADDSLEGRRAGTPGAESAARYVARHFADLGLRPPEGGYLQRVELPAHHPLEAHPALDSDTTANVIGILEGSDPALRAEAVLIGAHYDHLGWGGPGSLAPAARAIHNGADDNASGVAGMLELAELFASDQPRRTLVFAAFGAEENGNVGSRHYVRAPAWPLERTVAMFNLDMIGRLRESLTVYGTGTSDAWPGILDSLEAAAAESPGGGLPVRRVPDGFGPSDHASFYGAKVPILAFFTGPHEDYHRPSDDPQRVDAQGEVRVLELVAGVIEAVAGSDRVIAFAEAPVTERRAVAFRVALGTLPDYAFAGPGVRLSSVRPGGPAGQAGLQAGDVLLRLGGREIADIYVYTAILADLEEGRAVELVYARGQETHTVFVTPEAR